MITPVYCTMHHKFFKLENVDDISDIVSNKENLLWIDLNRPSQDELRRIAEEFNLHPLAVEDATKQHQRPKVEEYTNFYLVIFYSLEFDSAANKIKQVELAMFMGENYLITVHYEPIKELQEAGKRWESNVKEIEKDIGVLLYSLIDTMVDNYFPLLDKLVEDVEDLEERIFDEKHRRGNRNYVSDMLDLKRKLLLMRKIVAPERDLLNVLTRRDSPIFSEQTRIYFQDVYDHLVRVTDTVDGYRDLLSSAVDANLAVISNDLNTVMRTLTVFSIILMADALVAGVYGMNFVNIPELHWEYGYVYFWVVIVIVSGALFYYFKRKGWF
ncbi:MAG TPA: magnesium/cobalt transporter CorA [Chloroflexia bacterium]|nr:magnesium/cobalt transporter CorA [Chloroflexia bacterium]